MFEAGTLSALAWLLLAGASFRHRQAAGSPAPHEARMLQVAAAAIVVIAITRCGTDIDGEGIVRMLAGASVAGIIVVLALSAAATRALAPVRLLLRVVRKRADHGAQPTEAAPAR
ncbi:MULTISPECIES: hypothetical protein [unclassified Sphingomonas]|jgi:hypothetical protein|uniref:hypothetical protein n=1 Tax=unclassified Sphingomonas TaxID=196159 RepID=UPI000E10551D|nr:MULTISPECIES: hypothetical protein [unclassified Sphingomonas]AXJ94212.1 hypothetical protein DM480_00595 [Sphingomonas sp. FARSPH]